MELDRGRAARDDAVRHTRRDQLRARWTSSRARARRCDQRAKTQGLATRWQNAVIRRDAGGGVLQKYKRTADGKFWQPTKAASRPPVRTMGRTGSTTFRRFPIADRRRLSIAMETGHPHDPRVRPMESTRRIESRSPVEALVTYSTTKPPVAECS